MLRRFALGILASSLLTLASVAVAGAQGMPTTPPTAPPGPAMQGSGTAQSDSGPSMQGAPAPGVPVAVRPPPSRTHHPGDLVFGAPCAGCHVILDPCEFLAVCNQLPGGLLFPPALHWTTLRPNVPQFFVNGPYVCAPTLGWNAPVCVEAATAGIGLPGGGQFTPPGGQVPGAQPGAPGAAPAGTGASPTGPAGGQPGAPQGPGGQSGQSSGGASSSPPGAPSGAGEPPAPPR